MIDGQLLTFALVTLGMTMIPGANMMLVVRNSMANGHKAGIITALGGGCALIIHSLLSAFGLSMILVSSTLAFEIVRTIGAGYLIFLGVQSLWRAWKQPAKQIDVNDVIGKSTTRRSLLDGFITNLFSPETTVFYLAAVPQFIQPGESVLTKTILLASIHFVMRLVWYLPVALFVARIRAWLTRPRVHRGIESVAGTLLIGFGLRLLTAKR